MYAPSLAVAKVRLGLLRYPGSGYGFLGEGCGRAFVQTATSSSTSLIIWHLHSKHQWLLWLWLRKHIAVCCCSMFYSLEVNKFQTVYNYLFLYQQLRNIPNPVQSTLTRFVIAHPQKCQIAREFLHFFSINIKTKGKRDNFYGNQSFM